MDVLGSLGTLATNVKNVTLPGILAAVAFALLLWPPLPYDRVPTVIDNSLDIKKLQLEAEQLGAKDSARIDEYLKTQNVPACVVREGAESYKFLAIPGIHDRAAIAVKNQLILDDIDRTLLRCIEEEQALQGIEDQIIANTNAFIATRISERDGINTNYQRYVNSLSPLREEFQRLLTEKEAEILTLQTRVLNFQHVQKERGRRVLELQRLDKEVGLRLADAGRLRPTQKFDDILSGLGAHIVGFLTLVFAWGLLIDPINRAIFSFFYDNHFDDTWDDVRPIRQTPGQDAHDKWYGKKHFHWNSKPAVAVPCILILLMLAALVIYLIPNTSVPPATATIVCVSSDSSGANQSVTLKASVRVLGSSTTPSGSVQFITKCESCRPGATSLFTRSLVSGASSYESASLRAGENIITAQYDDGKKGSLFKASTSMPVVVSVVNVSQIARALFETCSAPTPNSELVPFWPLFDKSVAVIMLSFLIAYFLPGVLMLFAPLQANPPKPSDAEIEAFKELPSATLPIDQQVARGLIENLAKNLEAALAKKTSDSGTSRQQSEQDLVDEQVRKLAADLAGKLKRPGAVSQIEPAGPQTLSEFAKESFDNLKTKMRFNSRAASEEEPTDDSKEPSAAELKLAEDLVQKLVEDLKKKPAEGEQSPTDAQKFANDLIQQLSKDLVKNLASEARKPLTPEQKLAKEWNKISQPAYAIGQGLMARADFEALQNSYYSQSLISTGLILPLFLLVLAILLTPEFGLGGYWIFITLGIAEVLLLITGVDRRHKYLAELDGLISSAFLKVTTQTSKSAADKSSKSVADQITEALKAAKIVKMTKLAVDPGDPSAPADGSLSGDGSPPTPKTGGPNADSKTEKTSQQEAKDKKAKALESVTLQKDIQVKTPFKFIPGAPPASTPASSPASTPAPVPAPAPAKADTPGTPSQATLSKSSEDSEAQ